MAVHRGDYVVDGALPVGGALVLTAGLVSVILGTASGAHAYERHRRQEPATLRAGGVGRDC
jgi:hypothetical protein